MHLIRKKEKKNTNKAVLMIFSPTFPYREIILHDQLSDKNMF